MNKQKQKDISELRCSKCNSTQIYFRITTKQRVCKKCGNIEVMEEKK